MLKDIIRQKACEHWKETVQIRRHLHAHPELGFHELETSLFVQQQLAALGISYEVMVETGVVGLIKGKNPDKRVVALRADMDALPITEANDVDYKSQNEGVMHACGHDVHMACLLGAAKILKETTDLWEGTVKLIFQPGEEVNPGGASLMIKAGVLENPTPQAIFGLHVHSPLDCGKLSFRKGQVMASADELSFSIRGEGGHAAHPDQTVDTILAASQLVVSLQQVISRNRNPFSPSVLSVCSFQGGHTTNVIPAEVKLKGTFRAMDEQWRFKAHELIKTEAEGIAKTTGAEIIPLIDVGYPCVYNHPALTERAWQQAVSYMGEDKLEETELSLGAEDFGYYSAQIPGCFFRLGIRNEALGYIHSGHTENFMADEKAIEIGMGIMAWLGASVNTEKL